MVETISINQGMVRLWHDELPFRFPENGRWQTVALPISDRPAPKRTMLAAEYNRPAGPRSLYGMLGIEFVPDDGTMLIVRIPESEPPYELYADTLGTTDTAVQKGLPSEYAHCMYRFAAWFGGGTLTVACVAHGEIGSSVSGFNSLANLLGAIAFDPTLQEPETALHLERVGNSIGEPSDSEPDGKPITYFEPRVMRHITESVTEYAIHDVYFAEDNSVVGYTETALSNRARTVALLTASLKKMRRQFGVKEFICGDLGYTYDRTDILFWLDHINKPVIDYNEPGKVREGAITLNGLDHAKYSHSVDTKSASIDPRTSPSSQLWRYQVGDKPLEEFTLRDLGDTCMNGEHLEYVVPLMLEVLELDASELNPWADGEYSGELALALRSISPRIWATMPGELERLMHILRDAYATYDEKELKPELLSDTSL